MSILRRKNTSSFSQNFLHWALGSTFCHTQTSNFQPSGIKSYGSKIGHIFPSEIIAMHDIILFDRFLISDSYDIHTFYWLWLNTDVVNISNIFRNAHVVIAWDFKIGKIIGYGPDLAPIGPGEKMYVPQSVDVTLGSRII